MALFLAAASIASATRVVNVHVNRGIAPSNVGAEVHCESAYGTGITYTNGNGDATCYFSNTGGTVAVQAFYYQSCFSWWTNKDYGNPPYNSVSNLNETLSYGGFC